MGLLERLIAAVARRAPAAASTSCPEVKILTEANGKGIACLACVCDEMGSNNESVRKEARAVMGRLRADGKAWVFAPAELLGVMMDCCQATRNARTRTEVLLEAAQVLREQRTEAVGKAAAKAIKVLASLVQHDRDLPTKSAAIDCLVAAHGHLGQHMWKGLSGLDNRERDVIAKRIEKLAPAKGNAKCLEGSGGPAAAAGGNAAAPQGSEGQGSESQDQAAAGLAAGLAVSAGSGRLRASLIPPAPARVASAARESQSQDDKEARRARAATDSRPEASPDPCLSHMAAEAPHRHAASPPAGHSDPPGAREAAEAGSAAHELGLMALVESLRASLHGPPHALADALTRWRLPRVSAGVSLACLLASRRRRLASLLSPCLPALALARACSACSAAVRAHTHMMPLRAFPAATPSASGCVATSTCTERTTSSWRPWLPPPTL